MSGSLILRSRVSLPWIRGMIVMRLAGKVGPRRRWASARPRRAAPRLRFPFEAQWEPENRSAHMVKITGLGDPEDPDVGACPSPDAPRAARSGGRGPAGRRRGSAGPTVSVPIISSATPTACPAHVGTGSSRIPAARDHRNGRERIQLPDGTGDQPTTQPASFIAVATEPHWLVRLPRSGVVSPIHGARSFLQPLVFGVIHRYPFSGR
jgi:hypothetical protein